MPPAATALCTYAVRDSLRILERFEGEDLNEYKGIADMVCSTDLAIQGLPGFERDGLMAVGKRVSNRVLNAGFSPIVFTPVCVLNVLGRAVSFMSVTVRNQQFSGTLRSIVANDKEYRQAILMEYFPEADPISPNHFSIRRARLRVVASVRVGLIKAS
jgi:hypothetical protein